MDAIGPILSQSTSFIGVLSITSLVLILSSYLGESRVFFQTFVFGGSFAGSIAYLYINSPSDLANFWKEYALLSLSSKLALSVIVVAGTYLGGAMYLAPLEKASTKEDSSLTPASCDTNTTIEYPSTLPENDQKLFEDMFDG